MNRLNFRAWDAPNKEMLGAESGHWMYEPDNGFHCGYNAGTKTPGVSEGDWVNCPVMQLTGLRDRNGVEIFEGDILDSDFPNDDPCISEVVFENAAFRKKYTDWDESLPKPCISEAEIKVLHLIVIGNIYETPKLA